ncbi:hypothetical protein DFP88_101716 [Pseudoroseicyclus aestuarii]|uniref:Uncharacterized protein n=2 Tax=Pseudoroseicyclus aestuarii TaxID=1795041 RepID=A0A318SVV2_9RHOB|nr:hypothetical protein DFP88_101716 [Pseudoroseicyclus aestuarii]
MLWRLIWTLIKLALVLAVLGGVALTAYAYIGPMLFPADFEAPVQQVTKPVTLEVQE